MCGTDFEHTILVFLYRLYNGPDWNNDDNWLLDDNHCGWYGIVCHETGQNVGMVKEINLEDNNLHGTEYVPFWSLQALESLNLNRNNISVSFAGVSDAPNLNTLILSETQTSSLAGISGAKTSLTSLHVTSAALAGPIPDELFQLTRLTELFLSHNALNGTFATQFGALRAMRDLYLFDNRMTGTLPSELGRLVNLEHLSVGQNQFTGTIPPQITSLPFLTVLSLQQVQPPPSNGLFSSGGGGGMTGGLPALDGLPRLRELYLAWNHFSGTIPDNFLQGIIDKSQTITADISNNLLDGSIPSTLAVFNDLRLYAEGNTIEGISSAVCNKYNWMNGEVAKGCDAILCSPGTFNDYGRRIDSATPCEICTYPGSSMNYGSTSCGPVLAETFDDRSILFELYNSAGGKNWLNGSGWVNDNVPVCNWYGISCEPLGAQGTMTVTEISLKDNNLIGIVPSILYHLPSLKKLNLAGNNIAMRFDAIFRASKLEYLNLDRTAVTILDGIGKGTSLQYLQLSNNAFGWKPLPDELFALTALTDLNLENARLAGTIPTQIGLLSNLVRLNLVGNDFSGQIPSEIGSLGTLELLELSNNDFYGPLPSNIGNLTSLVYLFVDNYKSNTVGISGLLPSFSTMPALRYLHFEQNQFTGTIPQDFLSGVSNPSDTIEVLLGGSNLIGTIPSSLSKFDKMNIDLSDNLITGIGSGLCQKSNWWNGDVGKYSCDGILCPPGEFSSPFGRQDSLDTKCEKCPGAEGSLYYGVSTCLSIEKQKEKIILENLYKATGGDQWTNNDGWLNSAFDICTWYGISCREGSTVESILLGSNNLVGTIPSEIFQLPNLKFLWLYSNPIEFKFDGIGLATNLRSLLLDSTLLQSLDGIGNARSVVDIDIRFNNLSGKLPTLELEVLTSLQSFSASENSFTGPIPHFSGSRMLNTLRLGNNQLTGTLPSFSTHAEMKSLDFSDNKIMGSIPSNFLAAANPKQSIFLDLSNNQLTGTVPSELSRFSDLTIYLRDNMISGISPGLCNEKDWNGGDVGNFQCDGILCPSGTYSDSGRASRNGAVCAPCSVNQYFGSTTCGNSAGRSNFGLGLFVWIATSSVAIMVAWL